MVTTPSSIEIREVKELSELRALEDLQKEIWGCTDREIFPSLALIPLLEIGGVLLGAFDGPSLIGFVLGFPGIEDRRVILHSDMLAVKRAYRSRGVGYRLKVAQRERALAKGIDKITWTFDPLQSLNAHLNFSRLGVIADRYKINFYGETSSFLHRTGTDRLWLTWLLASERVKRRLESLSLKVTTEMESSPALVEISSGEPQVNDGALGGESLSIEVPTNINALIADNIEAAISWREATRYAFTKAMTEGYTVDEFYVSEKQAGKIGIYHLTRAPV